MVNVLRKKVDKVELLRNYDFFTQLGNMSPFLTPRVIIY